MNYIVTELIRKEHNISTQDSSGDCRAYLVEIIFKNGVCKEFWCSDFTISRKNGDKTFTWTPLIEFEKPLHMDISEICGVFVKNETVISKGDYIKYPKSLEWYKKFFCPGEE